MTCEAVDATGQLPNVHDQGVCFVRFQMLSPAACARFSRHIYQFY